MQSDGKLYTCVWPLPLAALDPRPAFANARQAWTNGF